MKSSLADRVMDRYSHGSKKNSAVIQEIQEALLMHRGDQWLTYRGSRSAGGYFAPAPQPRGRVRLTINKMPPMVQMLMSTYMAVRPIISATPASTEARDRRTAKIASLLLRHYWDELDFDIKLNDLLLWVFVTGNGFISEEWNSEYGDKIEVYEDLVGEDGVAFQEHVRTDYAGRPEISVTGPLSMTVEPGAERFDDAAWCMETQLVRTGSLEQRFNAKVEPDAGEDVYSGRHGPVFLGGGDFDKKERAALHKMWERPNSKHKGGLIAYVANNKVLHQEELPKDAYERPYVPVVHFPAIPLPGEMWATGYVAQGTPMQLEINRSRSQLVEARNIATNPMMLAADGSLVGMGDNIKARGGKIIYFNPLQAHGHTPGWLPPPALPSHTLPSISMAESSLMDLFSRHESTQGIASGSVGSYKQASLYREADNARLTPEMRRFERNLAKLGSYIVNDCARNMRGRQILEVVGKDRRFDVMEFEANEVSAKCNIKYEIVSQMPWSRDNMRQQVMWMRQQGIIDQKQFADIIDLPVPQESYELARAQRENARQENEALMRGFFPPIPGDDPAIHLEEHSAFISDPEKRQQWINELMAQQEQAQLAQKVGRKEEISQFPVSLQALMEHMNHHQKALPKQEPPPPEARLNLSVDRLLENPTFAQNPAILKDVLPMLVDLISDAAGTVQQKQYPVGQPEPSPAGQGAPSPPGGASGELYSAAFGKMPK